MGIKLREQGGREERAAGGLVIPPPVNVEQRIVSLLGQPGAPRPSGSSFPASLYRRDCHVQSTSTRQITWAGGNWFAVWGRNVSDRRDNLGRKPPPPPSRFPVALDPCCIVPSASRPATFPRMSSAGRTSPAARMLSEMRRKMRRAGVQLLTFVMACTTLLTP